MLWYDDEDPSNDFVSTFFMEAVNAASRVLLEGGSVQKAMATSDKIYNKYIKIISQYLLGIRQIPPNIKEQDLMDILGALRNNKENLIAYGN